MRSIVVTMWVSLDGVVQGLGRADEDTRGGFTHGGWGPRYDDEVMGREMAKAMTRPGDMLFGRRTWQDFTTGWGRRTDGNPFTTRMNATTKYGTTVIRRPRMLGLPSSISGSTIRSKFMLSPAPLILPPPKRAREVCTRPVRRTI